MKNLNAKNQYTPISNFFKWVHYEIERNKTFSMIPHLLDINKEYFYDEKYHTFSYFCFCFSAA